MPKVRFTTALTRFFPTLDTLDLKGKNVAELIAEANAIHPGLKDYLVDENGTLRQHVNVFIGENMIHDRLQLQDEVQEKDEILVFQALSGG